MAVYELSWLGVTSAVAYAPVEIVPGAGKPMSILEFGCGSDVPIAAAIFQLGRPSNTPTGGTLVTATSPAGLDDSGGASLGGVITAGWTLAPANPAAGKELIDDRLVAGVANPTSALFSWGPGELILDPGSRANDLILWLPGATPPIYSGFVKWIE